MLQLPSIQLLQPLLFSYHNMGTTADDVAPWLLRNNDTTTTTVVTADPLGFPSEFPYETEISDDEEDFFAALTRRLSHSSLQHSRKHNPLTSRVPSPFTTPFCENNDPREALYAAVAKFKYLNGETSSFGFHNRGFNLPHVSTSFPNQKSEDHVWGKNQVQQQQQLQNLNRGYESVKCTRHVGSAVRRNSGGTGVFLPRHHVKNSMDLPHKKSGFTPVLVPAKVVHALNVTNQSQFSNAFAIDYDALLARRNALVMHQLREEMASYESRLPKDWTY